MHPSTNSTTNGPVFHKGTLTVSGTPADTYLDTWAAAQAVSPRSVFEGGCERGDRARPARDEHGGDQKSVDKPRYS